MFEIIVRTNDGWIDLSGVSDIELSKALSEWSSGEKEVIKVKSFSFNSKDITSISVSR